MVELLTHMFLCTGSHTDHSGPLTLVLLGESGSGKSASGNTILERKAFPSETSSRAITIKCAKESKSMYGTTFEVIDTPDFSDENLQQADEHVKECRDLCQGGLCVYLLVIQIGRFTEGERGILERLERALGMINNRVIILFTHGDDLKPDQRIDDYVKKTNRHLQMLIMQCGGRYQVFNNRKRDEQQVKGLMGEIAKLVNTDHFKVFPELNAEKSLSFWQSWNISNSKHWL
ncbi:hypothetical protein ACEWY4_027461 [Coilia grayii]|uniref:AIG1-type G domain-containing protein n=1 Tax=Coilia grayii TaxID=363190 RepID=A0ABD1IPN4_9TELE